MGLDERFKNLEKSKTFALCTLLDPCYKQHVFEDKSSLQSIKNKVQNMISEEIANLNNATNVGALT